MLGRACECPQPRVFADSPEFCHRCGHEPRTPVVQASTWRLAIAVAEVMLGYRRIGDRGGKGRGTTQRPSG